MKPPAQDNPDLTYLQADCLALVRRSLPIGASSLEVEAVQTAFYTGVASALNVLAQSMQPDSMKTVLQASMDMGREVKAFLYTQDAIRAQAPHKPPMPPEVKIRKTLTLPTFKRK